MGGIVDDAYMIPNGSLVFGHEGLGCVIWATPDPEEFDMLTTYCSDCAGFVVTTVVMNFKSMSLIITEHYVGWAHLSPGMVVCGPL